MPDSARVDHSLARMQLDLVLLAVNLLDEGLVTGQRHDHKRCRTVLTERCCYITK